MAGLRESLVDSVAPAPRNPAPSLVGGVANAAAAGGIASTNAANGLAKYGWPAGEEALEWGKAGRSLTRLGSTLNFGLYANEIREGFATDDMALAGHGAAGVVFGIATIGSPYIAVGGGLIDLGVQQIQYQPRGALPGDVVTGWSAFPAMYRDATTQPTCVASDCP